MNERELRDQLEQLDQAIASSSTADADKQQLRQLIDDIERRLDPTVDKDDRDSLDEQVEFLVTSFETDHPTISGILKNIMVSLSSMGI